MWTPLLVIITFLCLCEKRLPPLLRFFKLRLPLHFVVLAPWIHGYFPLWEWNVRNGGNYIVDFVVGSGRHCWSLSVVVSVHSAVLMWLILVYNKDMRWCSINRQKNSHKTEIYCVNTRSQTQDTPFMHFIPSSMYLRMIYLPLWSPRSISIEFKTRLSLHRS